MLVTTKQLLTKARKHGYAVGAFNVNNLEVLQSIMAAARALSAPVIIQTSEGALEYAGLEYLKAITLVASKERIPIALHLDHGKNLDVVKECIAKGYTSVMYDGSSLPFAENLRNTKKVVGWASKKGVSVEAELGAIKGKEDLVSVSEREAFFTDPNQAVEFVAKTGIDALAIAIGTAHGPFKFEEESVLDFKRLAAIRKLVSLPLVLHGASGISHDMVTFLHKQCSVLHDCVRVAGGRGVSDANIKKAVKLGICKVNIDSDLRIAFTAGVRNALLEHTEAYDPRVILGESKKLMEQVVRQKIMLFGSKNRA